MYPDGEQRPYLRQPESIHAPISSAKDRRPDLPARTHIEPNIQSFRPSVRVKQRKNRAPMSLRPNTSKARTELPREVYLALVNSLFGNFSAMLAGSICVAVAATLTAWKTQEPSLWACAASVLVVGIARAIQMRRYEQDSRRPSRRRSAGRSTTPWARSRIADVGIWCLVGFGSSPTRPSTCCARS